MIKTWFLVVCLAATLVFAQTKGGDDRPLTPEEREKMGKALEELAKSTKAASDNLQGLKGTTDQLQHELKNLNSATAKMIGSFAAIRDGCGDKTWQKEYQDWYYKIPAADRDAAKKNFDEGWTVTYQKGKPSQKECQNCLKMFLNK